MGLVLFLGIFPNNCDVLSGGHISHKSYLLPTECPCLYESDCSVVVCWVGEHQHRLAQCSPYTIYMSECTFAFLHWEQSNRISVFGAESAIGAVWHLELRLFLLCYSTILCKQQHCDCSCISTRVSSGILSHFSYYTCIKLHDNNFRPVVWVWRLFHRYFVHFRKTWDSKASIINAFTTFLLLAFSKVLYLCIHTVVLLSYQQ